MFLPKGDNCLRQERPAAMEPMRETLLHIVEWWNPDEQRWEVQNSNPTLVRGGAKGRQVLVGEISVP